MEKEVFKQLKHSIILVEFMEIQEKFLKQWNISKKAFRFWRKQEVREALILFSP